MFTARYSLTTHYPLLTAYCSLLTTHALLTTLYSLLTAYYSSLTHYSLLTTHYSLVTAHYSPLTDYSLLTPTIADLLQYAHLRDFCHDRLLFLRVRAVCH